jgi:hypothetical protein
MSGTSSSSTFQPTISQTFATGTLVTVVVNYYINSTITEANKFATKTDVIGINVEKIGEKGDNGGTGPSGEQGLIGLRTVSGRVYFIYTTGTLPTEPAGPLTYDITSGTFDDALPTGWSLVQPTFEAGSQDDYYYSDFTGIETESSGGKAEISNFSTPVKAINFSGLVTFTGAAGEAISTTNSNITSIDGGLLTTSTIQSNNWDGPDSGEIYADAGMEINFNTGSITAKNFLIDSSGNAKFKGEVEAGSGSIGE